MKRDMDLVRALLLALERHPHGFAPDELAFDGADSAAIGYHLHLLGQAGLIRTADCTVLNDRSPQARALSLTWQGHEFLDACRNLDRWERAKALIGRAGQATFPVWQQVLADLMTKAVGL